MVAGPANQTWSAMREMREWWAMTARSQEKHEQATDNLTFAAAVDLALCPVDLALGLAGLTGSLVTALGRRATQAAAAVRPLLLRSSTTAHSAPAQWLSNLARRGRDHRSAVGDQLSWVLDVVVPYTVNKILDRLDLTAVVRERVDLDEVISSMNLDKAAARLDVDAIIRRLRTATVAESLDINTLADHLDIDAVVARLDVNALLDRLDLNRILQERINVDDVVRAVDLDAIIARFDLVGLAEEIVEAIDLPAIIRASTGSVASETVRGVRMHGVTGDEVVGRAIDRLLLRRQARTVLASEGDGPEGPPAGESGERGSRKRPPLQSSADVTPP